MSDARELATLKNKERKRIMANWDPEYKGESICWYDEYIQRNAPAVVNWLQQPTLRDGLESTYIEARGLALYRPDNPDQDPHKPETTFAVAPLDDGSVCLWDVTGAKCPKGAIYARSRPGILHGHWGGSIIRKKIDSAVTECVSVDSKTHLAFFAVQGRASKLPPLFFKFVTHPRLTEDARSHRGRSPQARGCGPRVVSLVDRGPFCRGSFDSTDRRDKQRHTYT